MAYQTQADRPADGQQTTDKIAEFKRKFYASNILKKAAVAHRFGNIELTAKEINRIRQVALLNLEGCLAELSRPEYQQFFQLIPDRATSYFAESVTEALNTISAASKSGLSSEEDGAARINDLTIIGLPFGIPVYVVSWLIYVLAKYFEESFPELGLFLFFVSVFLEYLGLYFIL
jgi:hypothetical protein